MWGRGTTLKVDAPRGYEYHGITRYTGIRIHWGPTLVQFRFWCLAAFNVPRGTTSQGSFPLPAAEHEVQYWAGTASYSCRPCSATKVLWNWLSRGSQEGRRLCKQSPAERPQLGQPGVSLHLVAYRAE